MWNKHNPGSKGAQELGCVCPVEDNNSGLWSPFGRRDTWILSALCEYHQRGNETEIERKIAHIESLMDKEMRGYIECDHGWDELIIRCHEELIALDPNYVPNGHASKCTKPQEDTKRYHSKPAKSQEKQVSS